MRILLDTHALVWWLAGDERLSRPARNCLRTEANSIFVSAATAWEITTKHRLGKLPSATALVADISSELADQGFHELPVSVLHGQRAGALPGPHRDPFDRMLVAQCQTDGLTIVSSDRIFDTYRVPRVW